MVEQRRDDGHFWYSDEEESATAIEVLNLLRAYRETETRMRSQIRDDMSMGEKDILALRYILAARSAGEVLRQKDLATMLSITGASASALVDRLCRDGYAERIAHPKDRRSVAVNPTEFGEKEVRETLRNMHQKMFEVVERMSGPERATVARFLRQMTQSITQSS